jgi:hypothetical protein
MLMLFAPLAAGGLLTLLIYVIVLLIIGGLIFWAVNKLSAAFGIPEPIRTVIIVLLVVIIVIGLVYVLLGATPARL